MTIPEEENRSISKIKALTGDQNASSRIEQRSFTWYRYCGQISSEVSLYECINFDRMPDRDIRIDVQKILLETAKEEEFGLSFIALLSPEVTLYSVIPEYYIPDDSGKGASVMGRVSGSSRHRLHESKGRSSGKISEPQNRIYSTKNKNVKYVNAVKNERAKYYSVNENFGSVHKSKRVQKGKSPEWSRKVGRSEQHFDSGSKHFPKIKIQ